MSSRAAHRVEHLLEEEPLGPLDVHLEQREPPVAELLHDRRQRLDGQLELLGAFPPLRGLPLDDADLAPVVLLS